MSYYPEDEPGFTEDDTCPYCGHDGYQYTNDDYHQYGVCCTYEIRTCKCDKCGKDFIQIYEVEYNHCGNAKTEEDDEE